MSAASGRALCSAQEEQGNCSRLDRVPRMKCGLLKITEESTESGKRVRFLNQTDLSLNPHLTSYWLCGLSSCPGVLGYRGPKGVITNKDLAAALAESQ